MSKEYTHEVSLYGVNDDSEFEEFSSRFEDIEFALVDIIEEQAGDMEYYEGEHTVLVRKDGEITKWNIYAEPTVEYSASVAE